MISIAIFGSGKGSNALAILQFLKNHPIIRVSCLVSDHPERGFSSIAQQWQLPLFSLEKGWSKNEDQNILSFLNRHETQALLLAGFLQKIPIWLISNYPDKILNIHPALLPKFGGKGMYGMHVHRAVLEAGEIESGITIHLVNEAYDEGKILFQASISLQNIKQPEALANAIHTLEHTHYPAIAEKYLTEKCI